MTNLALAVALLMASALALILWQRQRVARREAYIRGFAFPKGVFNKVIARQPHLTQEGDRSPPAGSGPP